MAATVTETEHNRDKLILRHTATMPRICAFGPLAALIFCHTMEVKRNSYKTHYTAIRTGLGFNCVKRRSVFEEHDVVFNLNVEITQRDIEMVISICFDI